MPSEFGDVRGNDDRMCEVHEVGGRAARALLPPTSWERMGTRHVSIGARRARRKEPVGECNEDAERHAGEVGGAEDRGSPMCLV